MQFVRQPSLTACENLANTSVADRTPKYPIFACMTPTALPSALCVPAGPGVAAGRPLRAKERHGASEHTVSRFTVSNTFAFSGQQYIALWMRSLSSLLFFSFRHLFSGHHDVSILQFTS